MSPAFQILGYRSEELLARPFLDFVHPDDQAATRAELAKLAEGSPALHFENRYRRKYLGFVRDSARHMAQLIDDLLALSQMTRSDLIRQPVDLSALARTVIGRLQNSHPDRRVDVTIEDGLADQGDPRLLAVVLDNLLGNAWKFTGRRAEPRIEFGATSADGRRVYFVRDNGAGFDMAFANTLFGVFRRLHTRAEFEGTGVGLASVQRVLERHQGRVWADAAPDRGATFFFTLYEKAAG